jgi:2-polyprenyl-6-methoxyphenol hydroxylase-like FAD-dependent oxidoreductase
MARIVMVGGSLGGLLAANMLHRAGHDVRVLEKSTTSLDGRGAGIVTHRPLMIALQRCGVQLDESLGVVVNRRVVLGLDGSVIAKAQIAQVLTSWSRLYAMLLSAFDERRYIRGAAVLRVNQSTDGVQVECEDGRTFDADMVVASDGIRSTLRAQLLPAVQAQYAGYVAWRGVCDEAVLSQRTMSTLFESFGFGLPPGEQLIGYPVAGANNAIARGQRRYNFVWYRPAAENKELKLLMTDADGHYFPQGIAPNKVAWQHIADVRQAARERLAPQFAEILEKTSQPFLQPIYDCEAQRMAFARVALMGDAACVARPHVGMGVTKAAEDAMALADCLATNGAIPEALQAFEKRRLATNQAVVQRGRTLGAYLQGEASGNNESEKLSAPTSARDARSVMLETAIDLSTSPPLCPSAPPPRQSYPA